MPKKQHPVSTNNARELRARQTKAEAILWSILRARRLGGLKFRRQHPIESWIADFACVSEKLIVELDGGYHDMKGEHDCERQAFLVARGWRVLRFANEDVLNDASAVAIGIARFVGRDPEVDGKRIDQ